MVEIEKLPGFETNTGYQYKQNTWGPNFAKIYV